MKKKLLLLLTVLVIIHVPDVSAALQLKDWIVLGPFRSTRDQVFIKPFINEETIIPEDGGKFGNYQWQKTTSGNQNNVDLLALFGVSDNDMYLAAYACTYVYSENEINTQLVIASDDGVQVWVNGLNIWQNNVNRGLNQGHDRINVILGKGLNRILLKITQYNGGWAFNCLLDAEVPLKNTAVNHLKTGLPPHNNRKIWMPGVEFDVARPELTDMKIKIISGNVEKINDAKIFLEKDISILAESGSTVLSKNIINEVVISVPVSILAGYMADENPVIKVKVLNEVIAFPLSKQDKLNYAISLGVSSANVEIQKKAIAVKAMMLIFGTNGNADIKVTEILDAVSKKQDSRVSAVFQEIYSSMLANMADHSKENIHVAGHAHIDMNWLWPYPETKKIMHDNIRQSVAFMEEFPDFTMLQSQAVIYSEIEKMDPPLFKKVQKYVAEGRFELVGGTWTEGDCNLASGEAMCRSFLLGQRYFLSRFGRITKVAWFPDNFGGHPSQLPQMIKLAGCDYFYFMRCKPVSFNGSFWWYGPDSSKLLCFSNDNYNGTISPSVISDIRSLAPGNKRILAVTGVGDHGGGPTRRDIDNVHIFTSIPKFANIRFTTAEDFFIKAMTEMEGRPSHKGEVRHNPVVGCYTSVAGIKEGNRNSEKALYQAEVMATLAWMNKKTYPADGLRSLWETLTFNEFHDILPGTAIYETNKTAVADYERIQASANDIRDQAFLQLADEIKFSSPGGQPVVAFNMHPDKKSFLVEAEIYTNERPVMANPNPHGEYYSSTNIMPVDVGQGFIPSVLVKDAKGKIYPAQVSWIKAFPPGNRMRVIFVADDIPAGGYKTFYIDPLKPGQMNDPVTKRGQEFETDDLKVRIDLHTGDLISLFDKRTNTEYGVPGKNLHRLEMVLEKGGDAWKIGGIDHIEEINNVRSVMVKEKGPVRACVESEKSWGSSKIIQRTYVYRSYPRVDIELEVHWFERSSDSTLSPYLKAVFPTSLSNATFYSHVPFDVVTRPDDGFEVPAQQWVDITDNTRGLALLNTTKYGHSCNKGELSLSLMRATHYPDRYPNIGVYTIRYSLYPHKGDWKNGVWNEADDYNIPVYAAEPPSLSLGKTHATRPEEASLISITPSSVVMTGIKQSEDGKELVVRIAEIQGRSDTATIMLPVKVKSVRRLNIIELPLANVPVPDKNGNTVKVVIKPHEIVTLGVRF